MKFLKAKGKSRKAKVKIIFLGFCFFLLVWIFLAPDFLIVEKKIEKADAIWVLGGSSAYLERTQKAAELYKLGFASKIFVVNDGVLSGWNEAEKRNIPFYELAERQLIAQGVSVEAIEVLPKLVESTNDEATLLIEIAQERQLKSVLLVTSPYHSRRTLWTFERAVLKNNSSIEIGLQYCLQETRTNWRYVGEEYVKIIYYWLFY